jgi:hypothetical protein
MNAPSNSASSARPPVPGGRSPGPSELIALVLSWAAVGLPLAWGVLETLRKALALFN